ncbi:autophagy protein, putative [Eimeria tenella]|uniref:Autophagy protein, putative n=1 Tax=Eimeria tenella TaxID=5802 RepID=U6L4M3_EIMTE|nr:autophagy protein, putative [Eimeria tenella]CDJ42725.1 autophagy protein, putative [Eimeria tenella]|eukprot:XP_013233475.1 autophagy protein, putative [Eimeria tenella]
MVESSREGAAPSSASSEEAAGSVEFEASERLELMESGLPLCIFLESSEVVAMRPPAPLYVFAPRVSYLPTLIDKCHEHFKPYIQPSFGQPTSPFFDFCGVPLDWRLPIGVAFDILSALKGGRARRLASCGEAEPAGEAGLGELAASGCDVELPWRLTIHFHGGAATAGGAPGAPAAPGTPGGPGGPGGRGKQVFGFAEFVGWAGFESFFLNALKQATYVMHGSAVPFQRLPKAAEVQLLAALRAAAVRDFLAGCSQLLPPLTPRHFRRIPTNCEAKQEKKNNRSAREGAPWGPQKQRIVHKEKVIQLASSAFPAAAAAALQREIQKPTPTLTSAAASSSNAHPQQERAPQHLQQERGPTLQGGPTLQTEGAPPCMQHGEQLAEARAPPQAAVGSWRRKRKEWRSLEKIKEKEKKKQRRKGREKKFTLTGSGAAGTQEKLGRGILPDSSCCCCCCCCCCSWRRSEDLKTAAGSAEEYKDRGGAGQGLRRAWESTVAPQRRQTASPSCCCCCSSGTS